MVDSGATQRLSKHNITSAPLTGVHGGVLIEDDVQVDRPRPEALPAKVATDGALQ